jgi:hypothetical protein
MATGKKIVVVKLHLELDKEETVLIMNSLANYKEIVVDTERKSQIDFLRLQIAQLYNKDIDKE